MITNWGKSKPPSGAVIDWAHPLTKGLKGCWLLNERSGNTAYNLAAAKSSTTNASRNGNANWLDNMATIDGSSTAGFLFPINTLGPVANGTQYIAINSIFRMTSPPGSGSQGRVFCALMATGGLSAFSLDIFNNAGTVLLEGIARSISTDSAQRCQWGFTSTVRYVNAFIMINYRDKLMTLYVDGQQVAKLTSTWGSTTFSFTNNNAGQDGIGGLNSAGNTLTGNINHVYWWVGKLFTQAEVAQLTTNPYSFIYRASVTPFKATKSVAPGVSQGIMTPRTGWWGDL